MKKLIVLLLFILISCAKAEEAKKDDIPLTEKININAVESLRVIENYSTKYSHSEYHVMVFRYNKDILCFIYKNMTCIRYSEQ